MQRKEAILLAATEHFGRFGFRGASLRDIARDAGVSLTLLNHHFGSKASLLSAAVHSQGRRLDARAAALAAVQGCAAGTWGVAELVQAWVRTDASTAATHEGRLFLQLVARIGDGTSHGFDPTIQAGLDRASPIFIDALQRCQPGASRRAAEWACVWVCAAINGFLQRPRQLSGDSEVDDAAATRNDDQERLVRFLTAGVVAALVPHARAHPALDGLAVRPATQESALTA